MDKTTPGYLALKDFAEKNGATNFDEWLKQQEMTPRTDCEAAYRRGYQQGYYRAAIEIVDGANASDVLDHAGVPLHDWRYETDINKTVCPPLLEVEK